MQFGNTSLGAEANTSEIPPYPIAYAAAKVLQAAAMSTEEAGSVLIGRVRELLLRAPCPLKNS